MKLVDEAVAPVAMRGGIDETKAARLPLVFDPFFSASCCRRREFPPCCRADPAFQFQLQPIAAFSDSGAKWRSSPAVLPRSLRVHRGEIRASPLPTDLGLPELLEVRGLLRVHTRIP